VSDVDINNTVYRTVKTIL